MVEFAACGSVLFLMLIGIIQLCLALYSYHFVADAAREATRWAMVRGSVSCSNTPNLAECNATSAQVQTFVQGLGYPDASALTATTTWMSASLAKPTTWSACGSGTCNAPGNEVQVKVSYSFVLNIPYWQVTTLTLSSTSGMVIAQ